MINNQIINEINYYNYHRIRMLAVLVQKRKIRKEG